MKEQTEGQQQESSQIKANISKEGPDKTKCKCSQDPEISTGLRKKKKIITLETHKKCPNTGHKMQHEELAKMGGNTWT